MTRYSLTATSIPLSFPYPDSLIPPNGDSAADELPAGTVLATLLAPKPEVRGETPTGIQPNHPRLEILQQTPNPVNIRGKRITRQTHTSIISLAHGFLLRPELVQRSNRRKALLPRDQHVLRHIGQDGGLEEVPALGFWDRAATEDVCAVFARIVDLTLRLVDALRCREGSHRGTLFRAVADDECAGALLETLREGLIHARLHVDAVRSDARLAGMAPFQRHELVERVLDIRIVEDDKGAVTAEFEGEFLQPHSAVAGDELPDAGGARERHLLDKRVFAQTLTERRRIRKIRGKHIEHSSREPGPLREIRNSQRRNRCFGTGLHDHGTTSRERSAGFAQDHGDGKVPGNQRRGDTNGLLDSHDATIGRRRHGNVAVDALGFTGEPPGEAGGVVDLAHGFGQRLTGFVGEDAREIGFGGADEGVPAK